MEFTIGEIIAGDNNGVPVSPSRYLLVSYSGNFNSIRKSLQFILPSRFQVQQRRDFTTGWWFDVMDVDGKWLYCESTTPHKSFKNEFGVLSKHVSHLNDSDKDYLAEIYLYLHPELEIT